MLQKGKTLILALGISALLWGCAGEPPPPAKVGPPKPPKEVEKKVAKVEVPEAEAAKSFSYDPKGKPDPFRPLITAKAPPPAAPPAVAPKPPTPGVQPSPVSKEKPVAAAPAPPPAPKTPLQNFSLDQLKVVGVIWQADGGRALVHDPGGKGYIVKEGTPIGTKNGMILSITAEGVVVEEQEQEEEGKVVKRQVVMQLGKGAERR